MMSHSTQDYDSSKYIKSRGMIGPLPPNYTCYRCGQPGHYIKHCPTNNVIIINLLNNLRTKYFTLLSKSQYLNKLKRCIFLFASFLITNNGRWK